ncbi:Putative Clr5 domain-containing protein [Colletotrichum destructivum]|uniref:Clr5 domain-containing protein n=1 Tax=Colletotrichum destructivum TaxID=34406 RepID=A0AAX4IPK0_9PEZI|nr:Putative Clr5 domain-containing protein [Colletotrichum destructivum]
MDLNFFPTATADSTLLGTLDGDQAASEPQLWDASAEYTELITSPGALGLMQGLAFRPASASKSLTTWPTTATGQPRVSRPESQEDWDAKKDTIRKLYLEENLPLQDVVDTMSKKHSFSATERMYKRQFQKWNWRKYNTKAYQQSHAQCIHVKSSRGMATCRRPARRRRPKQVPIHKSTVYHLAVRSNPNFAQDTTTFTIPLFHGNQTYEWLEKTYANLREIIVGTARRDPAWSQSDRYCLRTASGAFAYRQFELAFDFSDIEDYTNYGSTLRSAFLEVENTLHSAYEPIDVFVHLLVYIPQCIFDEERFDILKTYLLFLSQMLDIRRPEQPITLAATAMQKLFSTEVGPINRHTLDTMMRIVSDCYTEIRGEYDLGSMHARIIALPCATDDSDSVLCINGLQSLHHSCIVWLDDIAEKLGEASHEYHQVVLSLLGLATLSSATDYALELYGKGCALLTEANPASRKDWSENSLSLLSDYNELMAISIGEDKEDLAIFYLRESLSVREIICRKTDRDSEPHRFNRTRIASYRIQLIDQLASLGRVLEAAELRAHLAQSDYLLEMQEKDLSQLTGLFADPLPQECY